MENASRFERLGGSSGIKTILGFSQSPKRMR